MAVRFFAEGSLPQRLGFDDRPNPPWTMVPLNGDRQVTLAEGDGLLVGLRAGADASACIVTELAHSTGGRVFKLAGGAAKTVVLEARDAGGAVKASLEICVKKKKVMWTFIGLVLDRSARKSTRSIADAAAIMETANKIVTPQTNVEMKSQDSGSMRLSVDLPTGFPVDLEEFLAPEGWARPDIALMQCISSKPLGADGVCQIETQQIPPMSQKHFEALREYQIVRNVVATVTPNFQYNIFLVHNFKTGSSGLSAGTGAYTPVDWQAKSIEVCIMPDFAGAQELAHEFGHFLLRDFKLPGPGNHSLNRLDLMYVAPGLDSFWIPKEQANAMNKSGVV